MAASRGSATSAATKAIGGCHVHTASTRNGSTSGCTAATPASSSAPHAAGLAGALPASLAASLAASLPLPLPLPLAVPPLAAATVLRMPPLERCASASSEPNPMPEAPAAAERQRGGRCAVRRGMALTVGMPHVAAVERANMPAVEGRPGLLVSDT